MMTFRPFASSDEDLHRTCLSDSRWRTQFGVTVDDGLEAVLRDRLRPYPFVARFTAMACDGRVIGFVTVDLIGPESVTCVLSGGLHPAWIGSGFGVPLVVLSCELIFSDFSVSRIVAHPQHRTSHRILQRAGFVPDPARVAGGVQGMTLHRPAFPNEFSSRVLLRSQCPEASP